ncbi:DALR anticodon-binding domain-containing protein [Coleofasciculus sp. H7-2]|uniref:DALR anticodon-binding domain-containing protein n=1 Tax=Coleofasciculus sp. H7-2 TaxID=3351545 RepID=UPI00367067D2
MNLPAVNCLSLKQQMLIQLQAAIGLYRERYILDKDAIASHLTEKNVPLSAELMTVAGISLQRFQGSTGILYRSSVALKLAALWHLPALEIATELAAYLCASVDDAQGKVGLQNLTIQVIPPGFIDFQLTDAEIARWLQLLVSGELSQSQGVPNYSLPITDYPLPISCPQPLSSLSKVQYIHARCCSLLRLGHRENLIQLNDSLALMLVYPEPIPWLTADGQLQLVHPAERRLIALLLELLDELGGMNQPKWVKRAFDASQAFETFYSECRIFGEVKTQTPHLAQARLGLVGVTRSILKLLLQDRLGILAPIEL